LGCVLEAPCGDGIGRASGRGPRISDGAKRIGIHGRRVRHRLGLLRAEAYRFTGIALAIVMLVARKQPPWIIAAHRFVEVSIGIVVALVLTAVWPESGPPSANRKTATHSATTS